MTSDGSVLSALQQNHSLILIAVCGGVILAMIKLGEHFHRFPEQKLTLQRYIVFALAIMIFLPMLGGFVATVYIANGDEISPILAFQVGLTSPAIVQSLMSSAGNHFATRPVDIDQGQ